METHEIDQDILFVDEFQPAITDVINNYADMMEEKIESAPTEQYGKGYIAGLREAINLCDMIIDELRASAWTEEDDEATE